MKVKELTKLLSFFDDDCEVVLSGYEGGYYDGMGVRKVHIKRDVHKEWYYGPHDLSDDVNEGEEVIYLGVMDDRERDY